jgi:hypothetical protein
MNAPFWQVIPGQIPDDEAVDSGYRNAQSAWDAQTKLGYGRVKCLKTIEHELPADDPAHVAFESSRYCLIVPKEASE